MKEPSSRLRFRSLYEAGNAALRAGRCQEAARLYREAARAAPRGAPPAEVDARSTQAPDWVRFLQSLAPSRARRELP